MILIDIPLPDSCIECPLQDGDYGCCNANRDIDTDMDERPRSCPIIGERRKGKWVKVSGYATPGGDPVWCCSECGKGLHVYGIEHGTYGADVSDGQWVACPNCGAVMEEL